MTISISTDTATQMSLTWFEGLLQALGSTKLGRKWQCPAHGLTGDHSHSLSAHVGRNGGVVLYCHAGCTWREILSALRLPSDSLRNPPGLHSTQYARAVLPGTKFPPARLDHGDDTGWIAVSIDEHPYGDPTVWAWKVRERNRAGTKRMRWESLNPKGERVPGLLGRQERDMPLYRIREVRMAIAMDETVILVESESSVDALAKVGLYATTWAGGAASAPLHRLADDLGDAKVLLVPDCDDAGLTCAERIVQALPNARVQIGDQEGDDARDVLARHGAEWFR